jgi:hypothetical protein
MPAYTGSGTSKQVVLNQFGAVTVIPDAAHLLNRYNTNANYIDPATGACNGPLSANGCGTGGSPAFSIQSTTAIGQGTRM